MTVIDLPPRGRVTSFKVELLAGGNRAAADWPSISDDRDLRMYIFQSREFLDIWLDTIGRASRVEPAYDTAFGRHRVGHLLLQHLINQSVAQDFATFDLGIGDASYKNKWATHHLALQTHERAVTAAGRVYLQTRRVGRFVSASGIRTWFKTASWRPALPLPEIRACSPPASRCPGPATHKHGIYMRTSIECCRRTGMGDNHLNEL